MISERIKIREATTADAPRCAAIYAPYVTDSVTSFEEIPPDATELTVRIARSRCWLVAELHGMVVGFAYAASHRDRPAYQWAADVAVYVDVTVHGRGVGLTLYSELLPQLRDRGIWTVCAGITEPNPASTALHRSVGFEPVGTYRRIGWKAGAWRDVSWWQLHLRDDPGKPRDRSRCGSGDCHRRSPRC